MVIVAGTLADGEESMEYVAHERGVPVVRLPALQRELSPVRGRQRGPANSDALRCDARQMSSQPTRQRPEPPGGSRPAGPRRPAPIVLTFHGHVLSGYFDTRREHVFIQLERVLARQSGAIVAVSEEVRSDLLRLRVAPPEKIVVIPYGFDLSDLSRPADAERARRRATLDVPKNAFVVGWAGRLTAIKRPHDLVRTLAELRLTGTDALLVVVGDGPERPGVEALASELGVREHSRFVGYQRDMGHWYGMFDAFLLSSENEGTPVVAIEALASECPVVATDAGGTATVVRQGVSGFLAPVGDTRALATHLHTLASQPDLARSLGLAGSHDVAQRFALETMTDTVDALYRRLLDTP